MGDTGDQIELAGTAHPLGETVTRTVVVDIGPAGDVGGRRDSGTVDASSEAFESIEMGERVRITKQ